MSAHPLDNPRMLPHVARVLIQKAQRNKREPDQIYSGGMRIGAGRKSPHGIHVRLDALDTDRQARIVLGLTDENARELIAALTAALKERFP